MSMISNLIFSDTAEKVLLGVVLVLGAVLVLVPMVKIIVRYVSLS